MDINPRKQAWNFLGTGNLIVMYPSKGYELLNDNQIVVVDDVETLFFDALEKVGLYKKEHQQTSSFKPSFISSTEPRPCIIEALKQQLTGQRPPNAFSHNRSRIQEPATTQQNKSSSYSKANLTLIFKLH